MTCVVLVAACNGNSRIHALADAPQQDSSTADSLFCGGDPCNPLTQTGCCAGYKCTWIDDQDSPQPLGHIDCVFRGTVPVGEPCTYGQGSYPRFDNCEGGAVCWNGVCEQLCDPYSSYAACDASHACITHEGLFGPVGQPVAAGVCEPACNPLDDNDFLGSGNRTGSACVGASGCYGYPNDTTPTKWTCDHQRTSLVHRAACTTADGCANTAGAPYLDGCAQGYLPLLYDVTGSMQIDCIALCKPADCWAGNCGTASANLVGASPHTCTPADARGTFNVATATNNGDQCMYSWLFEVDTLGNLVRSPTSDTVGFCVDHSKYKYDSNGDGQVTSADSAWPPCDSFTQPGRGSGSALGAADFGCVSTSTAGVSFTAKPRAMEGLRIPYR